MFEIFIMKKNDIKHEMTPVKMSEAKNSNKITRLSIINP